MERVFRKTEEETYPRKIFAHQLITIDDLQQFRKQLMEELLLAIKTQPTAETKKMDEVPRGKKASQDLSRHFTNAKIFRRYSLH